MSIKKIVEREQIKVLIHLVSGKDSVGSLYIEPGQRLQELVNDGRTFLPFYGLVDRDKAGKSAIDRTVLINKAAILSIEEL